MTYFHRCPDPNQFQLWKLIYTYSILLLGFICACPLMIILYLNIVLKGREGGTLFKTVISENKQKIVGNP